MEEWGWNARALARGSWGMARAAIGGCRRATRSGATVTRDQRLSDGAAWRGAGAADMAILDRPPGLFSPDCDFGHLAPPGAYCCTLTPF